MSSSIRMLMNAIRKKYEVVTVSVKPPIDVAFVLRKTAAQDRKHYQGPNQLCDELAMKSKAYTSWDFISIARSAR